MGQARRKEGREERMGSRRSTPLPSLRRLRQRRALTQRELGKAAEVSPGTVFRLEVGLRGAYPATVRKLAAALGVAPSELVRGPRPE